MVASENSETASKLGWLEVHNQLVVPAVGTGSGGHLYTCVKEMLRRRNACGTLMV